MEKQIYSFLIYCIVFLLCCSCTMTSLLMLGGDSEEAAKRRQQFTDSVLESCSPENCGYSSMDGIFGWCLTGTDVTKINKRVRLVREKILDYFEKDPWAKNKEIFDRIILEDLYYCRDENGGRLAQGPVIMYCETKLSTNLGKKFSRNHIEYLGEFNELFKYKIELE